MKKENAELGMKGYGYGIDHIVTVSEDPVTEYGDYYYDHSIYPSDIITRSAKGLCPDVVSNLDIKNGDKIYIVYAVWSTGDSFGQSDNSESECFGLFKDVDSAKELAAKLESSSEMKDFVTSDGQVFNHYSLPWDGYFESLSYVECKDVTFIENGN